MSAIITITECDDDMDVNVNFNGGTEDEKLMAIQMLDAFSKGENIDVTSVTKQ